jgi:hypothetical protein
VGKTQGLREEVIHRLRRLHGFLRTWEELDPTIWAEIWVIGAICGLVLAASDFIGDQFPQR